MTRFLNVGLFVCGLLAVYGFHLYVLLLAGATVLSIVGELEAGLVLVVAAFVLAVYNLGVEVGRLDPPRYRR